MPFRSEAQRRWMYANHPEMAARWEAHTAKNNKLPERVKDAQHALDRLRERTDLDPGVVPWLEAQAERLSSQVAPGHYYLPIFDTAGGVVAYAAFKTVDEGSKKKLVLATILGPNMRPQGSSLSHLIPQPHFAKAASAVTWLTPEEVTWVKTSDVATGPQLPATSASGAYTPEELARLTNTFEKIKQLTRNKGVLAGTAHNRIAFPKSVLTEKDLTHGLGFVPVTVAIPEAGQDRFQSFRHPDHNFHVHSHNDFWTIHEDEHPAATMLAKKETTLGGKTKAMVSGVPHAKDEGLPGLYYYVKGVLGGHKSTARRVIAEMAPETRKEIASLSHSPRYTGAPISFPEVPEYAPTLLPPVALSTGKMAALAYFGVKEAEVLQSFRSSADGRKKWKVSLEGSKYTCTCPDFRYRHVGKETHCKHIKQTLAQRADAEKTAGKTRFTTGFRKVIHEEAPAPLETASKPALSAALQALQDKYPQHDLNLAHAPSSAPAPLDPLLLKLLDASPVKVTIQPEAYTSPENQGFYGLDDREIELLGTSPNTLAHEIGHAQFDKTRLGNVLQSRLLYPLFMGAHLGGTLSGYWAGNSGAAGLPRALAMGVPLLTTAPAMVSEAAATYNGHKLLRDSGATPEQLAAYRKDMLNAYGSYAAFPAATALATLGSYALGRKLNGR